MTARASRVVRTGLWSGLALLATLGTPAVAAANGRFPFANQLVVKSGPEADTYVRTSFGVLVSRDRGAADQP